MFFFDNLKFKIGCMHKGILKNIFSLSLLQLVNYAYPLLIFPLITRALGPEKFGEIAFSMALAAYFMIIVDYGFNLTATRDISINREDPSKVRGMYNSVMSVKISLLCLSVVALLIIITFVPMFQDDPILHMITFSSVIGNLMIPIWFFQGMEKMKFITILNVIPKLFVGGLVVILIKEPDDYLIFPLLNSLSYLFSGIASLLLLNKKFDITFRFCSYGEYKKQLKVGWDVFLSGAFTSLYTTSAVLFLGLVAAKDIVGYYALSEKIVKVLGTIMVPINTAIFPFLSKLISVRGNNVKKINNTVFLLISMIMAILSVFIYYFAAEIVLIVGGKEFDKSIYILKVLSPFPVIITMGRYLSINYIIANGYQKVLPRIYFCTALFAIGLFSVFIPIYEDVGTGIAVLVVETLAVILMLIFSYKKGVFNEWK
jgi:PST family polysaccharide transporter